jgi:putative flippase GtrA
MIHKYPKILVSDLCKLQSRARLTCWRTALAEILRPDAPGTWQINKYLLIGVSSIVVFYATYGIFRLASECLLPEVFATHRLAMNLAAIFIAFVPTNWFTYSTNRRWVFTGRRHAQSKEFTLFTLAAACSFLASQFLVAVLVLKSPLNDFVITLLVIVLSTAVNFAFRKFVVFHG